MFYRDDVVIDHENLNNLPVDGNVADLLQSVYAAEAQPVADNADAQSDENNVFHSGVPMAAPMEQEAAMQLHLQKNGSADLVPWPAITTNAINEFSEEGYIARAFPALFSRGAADLRGPSKESVSPSEYCQHLMNHHDQRFAKDPRFRFFALNSVMRWQALTQGSVCVMVC